MKNLLAGLAGILIISVGALVYLQDSSSTPQTQGFEQFDSEQEFVSSFQSQNSYYSRMSASGAAMAESSANTLDSGSQGSVRRSSETNIQVSGVGEPDILKNAGEKIYYSPGYNYRKGSNTTIFSTLPIDNFSESGKIPAEGNMFLTDEKVISLGETISAYDRGSRDLLWEKELNASVEAARRLNGNLYLVLRDRPEMDNPCPLRPMSSLTVPCTDIYHPEEGNLDTTFTLVKMGYQGEIEDRTSFAGSSSNTVVYMSENSIYLTYTEALSEMDLLLDFIEDEGEELLNSESVERIEELKSYDISDSALRIEVQRVIENYISSLEEGERTDIRTEIQEAAKEYTSERKRDLQETEIAKFNLDLQLDSEGSVPGKVDDRYSLSESDGTLRISTTIADSWTFNTETENDLYTLNNDLETIGSVKGMGLNEQIYSTRYIGDKAYIVTFRRIDPFHVVDLSDPENPKLKGKLKLPGFSSYLHPLQEDRILGVGEENGTVKAVIFDVEDDEPEVLDSKVLEDYNSEVSQNSRAFQIDRENKVFFLPASDHAYFFNYSEGLEKEAEIEMDNVQRGAYVNQNFYIFNDYKAKAVKIGEWEVEKEVEFAEEGYDVRPLPGPVRVD